MAERVGVGTVVLIAGLVSLISSATVAIWWERQLDQRLVMRPPVMILDLLALARATDPEALTAMMRDPATLVRHERVPVKHFWIMGETSDSFDSRYWGFLPQSQVVGKAYALF